MKIQVVQREKRPLFTLLAPQKKMDNTPSVHLSGEETEDSEEHNSVVDWNYKKFPNNPFVRSNRDKLLIVLSQMDNISNRIAGTSGMWETIKEKNLEIWKDREPKTYSPEEFPDISKSMEMSKELKDNIAPDSPFEVFFIETYEGTPLDHCSINLENFSTHGRFPLVYFRLGKWTKLLTLVSPSPMFLSNVSSKEEIKGGDLSLVFYQIALLFHHNSFKLDEYEFVSMWIDISRFPRAVVKISMTKK